MHRFAAVLLLLPGLVSAEVVFVDYVGVVDQVDNAPPNSGYRLGDPVEGRLLIDLVLGPRDQFPHIAESGSYSYFLERGVPDWITGYSDRGTETTLDRVFTRNTAGDDSFQLTDGSNPGTAGYRGIEISVVGLEFLKSDALDQSVHVTRADGPGGFAGSLRWGWAEATRHVSFALKSFKLTPGRCMAPR